MMRLLTYCFALLLSVSLLLAGQASAASTIQLFLNGKALVSEVAPRIVNDNTMVPIRVIAESIGSEVGWDGKQRKVTVKKDEISIQLIIDNKNVLVNGKTYQLEAAPVIVDGNTLLPLRFVSEQLGVKVTWDELTRSVFLYKQEKLELAQVDAAKPPQQAAKPVMAPIDPAADKPADKPAAKPTEQPAFTSKPNEPLKAGETAKPAAVAAVPSVPAVTSGKVEKNTIIKSIVLKGDKLSIATDGAKVVPNVNVQEDPHRVILDIPSSMLDPELLKTGPNGEGKIQVQSDTVLQIRYLLFSKEASIVRIIVDLSKKVDFRLAAQPAQGEISAQLVPVKTKFIVVVDAGHGGKDTGAISVTKRREKDFVLELSHKVTALLKQVPQIEVRMTRSDDTFYELPDRVAIANDLKADLFVSVHANSATKETIRGTETYYHTEQSLAFAKVMHEYVLGVTGFPDRKVKQGNFYVIRNTEMPSVLLEIGFLSNRTEEALMFEEAFQEQLAAAIAAGIQEQLKLMPKE